VGGREAGDDRPDLLDRAVRVEPGHDDIAADFPAFVPRAVADNEDCVAIFLRERFSGVEPHAERRAVRPELCDGLGELVAAVAPTELRVGNVAASAIGEAEIVLAWMEQAV